MKYQWSKSVLKASFAATFVGIVINNPGFLLNPMCSETLWALHVAVVEILDCIIMDMAWHSHPLYSLCTHVRLVTGRHNPWQIVPRPNNVWTQRDMTWQWRKDTHKANCGLHNKNMIHHYHAWAPSLSSSVRIIINLVVGRGGWSSPLRHMAWMRLSGLLTMVWQWKSHVKNRWSAFMNWRGPFLWLIEGYPCFFNASTSTLFKNGFGIPAGHGSHTSTLGYSLSSAMPLGAPATSSRGQVIASLAADKWGGKTEITQVSCLDECCEEIMAHTRTAWAVQTCAYDGKRHWIPQKRRPHVDAWQRLNFFASLPFGTTVQPPCHDCFWACNGT